MKMRQGLSGIFKKPARRKFMGGFLRQAKTVNGFLRQKSTASAPPPHTPQNATPATGAEMPLKGGQILGYPEAAPNPDNGNFKGALMPLRRSACLATQEGNR